MSRRHPLYVWTRSVATHFPHLSKPQATVLALWSFGIVLAKSCTLSAVANILGPLLDQSFNTARERLRDWYKSAPDKSGSHRRTLDVTTCFAPVLAWILERWPSRRLALALDATTLHDTLTVLSLSVVYRGTAIPVAWKVLRGNTPHAWKPEWLKLLHWFRDQIDPDWTVVVLTDRGLYARWLFERISSYGWHPMMRITRLSTFLPAGWHHPRQVTRFVPHCGQCWQGRGLAFPRKPERRLPCTLLAWWAEDYDEPWFLVTDLAPEAADAAWYGLRTWIEHGFEQFKSTGWQWQKTRMTAPDRAARVWLALALATLWVVAIGGRRDHTENDPVETMRTLPASDRHPNRPPERPEARRLVSVLQQGIAALLARLVKGRCPLPREWHPEAWPEIAVIIQEREHEQISST